ncbi:hypothetical protein IQ264_14285 [Phormidium sp. LEGE 05292]|uniref:hypothetical protein n=1 Tax=[Phormidium] sp. LEGE 05292 TaxID=767427 RepID=UPI00187E1634|nr:hypothetical protein [Phormidium sp. LEGE 05292]MBE9226593.1 hypothetical protein [Phormidium sp. LEGE 05292]
MNELVSTVNQVLDQRFPEYNRMLLNLLKMDTQMIVSIANKTNHKDEKVRDLITQLNTLIQLIEDNDDINKDQEMSYLSIRRYLKGILNNAVTENGGMETE